ncbi:MAG: hypothetical protein AB7P49_04325 [Bdellovibrionales bacterium]
MSFLVFVAVTASGRGFERRREFPNYFLPPEWRFVDPDSVPEPVIRESIQLLEGVVQHHMQHLTIPISTSPGHYNEVRYFDEIENMLPAGVGVLPASGVVRADIGTIYARLYDRLNGNPTADARPLLRRMAVAGRGQDLQAIEVRGIGSDFDLLLRGDSSRFQYVADAILRITNSAENGAGLRNEESEAKRTIFAVGDVKPYDEQILLATSQGGSTIDWLSFDVRAGKFVEPSNHRYIVRDLVLGRYRYLQSIPGVVKRDAEKQTLRGARPLIEMPFIDLYRGEIFDQELDELLRKVGNGFRLPKKSADQVQKMMRNQQASAGNNLIYRAAKGTREAKLRLLNEYLRQSGQNHIPEFVEQRPIDERDPDRKSELNGINPRALIPASDFIARFGAQFYHGTPRAELAVAILRGGMYLSGGRSRQGAAARGTGGYASTDIRVAKARADVGGTVLALPLKNDRRVNILWSQSDPTVQAVIAEAQRRGKDVNLMLAEEHGIDAIWAGTSDNVLLILNTRILALGDSISDRLNIYVESLLAGNDRRNAVHELNQVFPFLREIGIRLRLSAVLSAMGEETDASRRLIERITAQLSSPRLTDDEIQDFAIAAAKLPAFLERPTLFSRLAKVGARRAIRPEAWTSFYKAAKSPDDLNGTLWERFLEAVRDSAPHQTFPNEIIADLENRLSGLENLPAWESIRKRQWPDKISHADKLAVRQLLEQRRFGRLEFQALMAIAKHQGISRVATQRLVALTASGEAPGTWDDNYALGQTATYRQFVLTSANGEVPSPYHDAHLVLLSAEQLRCEALLRTQSAPAN